LVGKEKGYMTRDEIKYEIIRIFREQFEIENPGLDEDLREKYEFDSIDAIELLREIEIFLNSELTRAEKKKAMEIRTVNQILDYVGLLSLTRAKE
jgi:acyl carrier protein